MLIEGSWWQRANIARPFQSVCVCVRSVGRQRGMIGQRFVQAPGWLTRLMRIAQVRALLPRICLHCHGTGRIPFVRANWANWMVGLFYCLRSGAQTNGGFFIGRHVRIVLSEPPTLLPFRLAKPNGFGHTGGVVKNGFWCCFFGMRFVCYKQQYCFVFSTIKRNAY